MKRNGEKERHTLLNAEFQRIARRDKKAFLSDQCNEIEENNRMGKTRDIFKKIRDTKGTFHTVHGVLKARILKWFAIPFSSGPHSVRPLHHDPPILGCPTGHGLVSFRQGCGPCDHIG